VSKKRRKRKNTILAAFYTKKKDFLMIFAFCNELICSANPLNKLNLVV